MAADEQLTCDGEYVVKYQDKLEHIGEFIVGCSGRMTDIKKFKEWFRNPTAPRPKLTSVTALVMRKSDCWEYDETCIPHRVVAPHAIGSGAKIAIGAMKAGATAKRAVEITAEIDLWTGGEVSELRF